MLLTKTDHLSNHHIILEKKTKPNLLAFQIASMRRRIYCFNVIYKRLVCASKHSRHAAAQLLSMNTRLDSHSPTALQKAQSYDHKQDERPRCE